MLTFRVIVVDDDRNTITSVVLLERSPDLGQELELPDGRQVIVRQGTSGLLTRCVVVRV
jgi:hypothetical protein